MSTSARAPTLCVYMLIWSNNIRLYGEPIKSINLWFHLFVCVSIILYRFGVLHLLTRAHTHSSTCVCVRVNFDWIGSVTLFHSRMPSFCSLLVRIQGISNHHNGNLNKREENYMRFIRKSLSEEYLWLVLGKFCKKISVSSHTIDQ